MREPRCVLMADPAYFDVLYAINPYMKTEGGELQKVDRALARKQWAALRNKYSELGIDVEVLPALHGHPDFVFCANQSFPYWNEERGKPSVILARMRSDLRQGEVAVFERWFKDRGYDVERLQFDGCFEGNGDALIQYRGGEPPVIWGGHGPRTDRGAYSEIAQKTGFEVKLLPLGRAEFYHMDTCFSILSGDTVVVQPEAFSGESLRLIRQGFKNVIETSFEECSRFFTGNCHSPNGKDVILQSGCPEFESRLRDAGFVTHPVDVSEFLKSGGSVFCMKTMIF